MCNWCYFTPKSMEIWAALKDLCDVCHNYFLLRGIRSHPTELSSEQLGPWLFAVYGDYNQPWAMKKNMVV